MIEIFSAVLGFAAPFLPEVLKYFNRKQDNAHELEMMKLQIEKGAAEHTHGEWKKSCDRDCHPHRIGVCSNLLGDVAPSFPLSER